MPQKKIATMNEALTLDKHKAENEKVTNSGKVLKVEWIQLTLKTIRNL